MFLHIFATFEHYLFTLTSLANVRIGTMHRCGHAFVFLASDSQYNHEILWSVVTQPIEMVIVMCSCHSEETVCMWEATQGLHIHLINSMSRFRLATCAASIWTASTSSSSSTASEAAIASATNLSLMSAVL